MEEPSPELNEAMERLKEHFADRLDMGWTRDGKEYVHIYITILKDNDRNVHYELGLDDWKIELHFEGKDYETKYGKLIDYLKSNNCNKYPNEEWENKYDKCDCYKFQCLSSITKENLCEKVKEFVDFFDELIEKGKIKIEEQQKINTPEQLTEKDDGEFEKQVEDVELYTRNLDSVIRLRNLSIPDYQRIYCWEDKNVIDLWDNLVEMPGKLDTPDKPYHLGTVILHNKKDGKYDIIDGQQRLVTLTIILNELGYEEKLPLLDAIFESKEERDHIANTKFLIEGLKKIFKGNIEDENKFKGKILKNLIFSVLVLKSDNLDLAYTFFSNQNSKGVELSDYDLLKAHHLRYIYVEEEQEHLARSWNKMIGEDMKKLEKALGTHLYRMRKWMRKRDCEKARLSVKEEFSAAPVMKGIPPFGEKFDFYETIRGGAHFFAYANHFVHLYKEFAQTKQCGYLIQPWGRHAHYGSVIETCLFAYFLKFGKQYLSEALFCIAGIMAQHRYECKRATGDKVRKHANDEEIIMMIDQANSPTFFLAEALNHIKISGKKKMKKEVQNDFYRHLKKIFNELNSDFTDETIKENAKNEYGI